MLITDVDNNDSVVRSYTDVYLRVLVIHIDKAEENIVIISLNASALLWYSTHRYTEETTPTIISLFRRLIDA